MEKDTLPSNSNAKLGSAGSNFRSGNASSSKKLTFAAFWRRAAIVLVVLGACWILWGLTREIEQEIFEWTEHEQKVHRSRPHLAKVGRYSPEHRYRPAASPIVKETDRWGRVNHHGQYHF